MSQSDIFAVTKTADATVFAGRARVRQIQVHTSGSGSPAVVLKDGGSGGTTLLSLTFTTSNVGTWTGNYSDPPSQATSNSYWSTGIGMGGIHNQNNGNNGTHNGGNGRVVLVYVAPL